LFTHLFELLIPVIFIIQIELEGAQVSQERVGDFADIVVGD
jgi:hypothetical protein